MNNKNVLAFLWNGGKMVFGSFVFAVGFQYLLLPNSINPGGVSGIAMIINYLTGAPSGVLIILVNIPIFLFAWRALGRRFLFSSVFCMLLYSVFVDVLGMADVYITSDKLLSSVFGGVFMGAGLGLVFSAGASTGGSDIIARLLAIKLPHLNLGQLLMLVDFFVVIISAAVFGSYESALYALIAIFLSSKVIDIILYGFNYAKVAYIISDNPAEMGQKITDKLGRGATVLYGRGAYSGKDKEIIMCAIKRQQIVDLKRTVHEVDEGAFLIISEAREVFGLGFSLEDK